MTQELKPLDPAVATAPRTVAELVDHHGSWLLSWFRRRAPAGADPEDLAQEALLVLCRRADVADRPAGAGPFLLEVARRLLGASVRHAERRAPGGTDEVAAPAEDPAEAAEAERLADAVRGLPDELQQVIDVYYSRDVTYEEAAAILGVPRATVHSRLRRALARLRQRLADEGERA